jgi:ferredoxin/flavodoxin---NADP+ reductase
LVTVGQVSRDSPSAAGRSTLRVAVIGAGPAGIYATAALLAADPPASVDVFEALPAPFGLVRYGVAPDHPKIQSVANQLAKILESPDARFFGNVEYGADLTLADLSRHYHAVVWATGAPNERALGVPGENLPGAFAAAEFVAWYNGHPAAVGRDYLSARQAVVVGAGNVALDVARMLVTDAAALVDTDMPQHVLDAWRSARATDVYVLARRGPAYAKFTTPELRELNALDGVDVVVDRADLVLDAAGEEVVAGSRAAKRNLDVLRAWADQPSRGRARPSHLMFWTRPTAILGTDRVAAVATERTALDPDGRLVATAEVGQVRAQALFRAIGYAGQPLPGLPFDNGSATIPNVTGRVTGADRTGVYVAGWIKRGPVGVIGTNKSDATETVRTLLADLTHLNAPPEPDLDAVTATLEARGVRYVRWDQWLALDAHELTTGARLGRPRLKVATVSEMLHIATRS